MLSLRRLVAPVAAVAPVILLGGFAGAPDAVPDKKTPTVCKLVTTREAAKILGTEVNKGKEKKVTPRPGAKASQCEWESKKKGVGGIDGAPFKLEVELNTGATVGSDYEKIKAGVDIEDLETLPDLGLGAFYDTRPFKGVHVLVAEDRVLSASVQNFNTAKADLPKPPAEMSIDAAKIAYGRLTK